MCILFNAKAYHSNLNAEDNRLIGNMALLPLRTQFKGPAPKSTGMGKVNDVFACHMYLLRHIVQSIQIQPMGLMIYMRVCGRVI